MAPSKVRVKAAMKAMEGIGVSRVEAEPVLMKLLKVCKNRWKPIEKDNYSYLVNTIFDEDSKRKKHYYLDEGNSKDKLDESEKKTESHDDLVLGDQSENDYVAMEIPIQTIMPNMEIPLQTVMPEVQYEAPIQPVCPFILIVDDSQGQQNQAEPSMRLNKREEPNLSCTEAGGYHVERGCEKNILHSIHCDATTSKLDESEKETTSLDDLVLGDQSENDYVAMEIPIQAIMPDMEIPLQTVMPEVQYEAPIQPVCPFILIVDDSQGQQNQAEPSMRLNKREEPNLSCTEAGGHHVERGCEKDILHSTHCDATTSKLYRDKAKEAASHDYQMIGREKNRSSDQLEKGNVTLEIPLHITLPDNVFEACIAPVYPSACRGMTKFKRPQIPSYDITKGNERYFIPLNDEGNISDFPGFKYIENNYIHDKAHASILTFQIRDTDCSLVCSGDCITAPCSCACATNCAYTSSGLVREDIIDTCMTSHQGIQFCKNCPAERIKSPTKHKPCKGHIKRDFIKECWIQCGCAKKCGNRVVQRGITCQLEVFCTSEGKGWGLRTKEDLDKGVFVCEYVGEVLTTMEYYNRRMETTNDDKLIHPVALDANWATEESCEDEKTLWLDATHYSNVARFINHRCFDANLVEIPVEIEKTGHHYYRLAFFTTRKIKANEELHWDYGINFNDGDNPTYAFKCLCGSKKCRDRKHISECTTTSLLSPASAPSVLRRSTRNEARTQNGIMHDWSHGEYCTKGGAVKKKSKGAARASG